MFLSVMVPCHNEADSVRRLYDELCAQVSPVADRWEVVFVDDGSTDATLGELRALAAADPRCRYLSFSRNFGKEAAMLAGLTQVRGEAVVLMDADLQHPPELIPAMVERYLAGHDQVVARRTRAGDPPLRSALSRLYYRLVNLLVDVRLTDGVGDYRLLSRRALDAVLALPEYNRFSKGLFAWIGFEPAVIDYDNVARDTGRSSWSMRSLFNYAVDGMLSFNDRPIRLSLWLGLFVSASSFLYVLWLVLRYAVGGADVPGYITIMAGIAGLGGIQLIFLGVIGQYVGRIYHEVKRRPHYVVSEASDSAPTLDSLPEQRPASAADDAARRPR
jgi:polyisoprenyl-phosphate glycosyltransferase